MFEPDRSRVAPTINLSALIDIAFILVIFVVLAANFDRIGRIDVDLPEAGAASQSDQEALRIVVPVTGPYLLDGEPIPEEDLATALRQRQGRYDSILLVADRQSAVERAVEVLNSARNAGYESVSFATDAEGK